MANINTLKQNYALYFTPSFSLTILLESERGAYFARLFEWLSEIFRAIWRKPSVLKRALKRESDKRGYVEGQGSNPVISAATLRVVDHQLFKSRGFKKGKATSIYPDELVSVVGKRQGITKEDPSFGMLSESVFRVLHTYEMVDTVYARSKTPYALGSKDDNALKELFTLLRPDDTLNDLISKQWQDIGFQGSSPPTDFRGLGILALDELLFFAREYGDRAVVVFDEGVNGGENWYPVALASMHMTSFALSLGVSRDLQMILLRSLQTGRTTTVRTSDEIDTTPFLRVAAELLLLFHEHWRRNNFTVMQFEAVSKDFQRALAPWIRRGVIDGRALGWIRNERNKLD